MNAPAPGSIISHYRILQRLGAGGMGEVYLAEDTGLNRKVAIKLLPADSIADPQAKRRLVREAQAAAAFDHPNICAIHEVGEEDGRSFIVMQYVEGETLASRIRRKPLELRESLDIAVHVADALAEAHSRGIIHRDVKPQNVMLTARSQVKVLDFGLAALIPDKRPVDTEADTLSMLTAPGTTVGTVAYMSPEQVRGLDLDGRSDIFSLGVTIYQMVAGRLPFEGSTPADALAATLKTDPAPLADFVPSAPTELQRIVSRALSKDRGQRYQTCEELLADLRGVKDEIEFATKLNRTPGAVIPSRLTPDRLFSPRRALIPLVMAALIGAAWWTLKGFRDRPEAERSPSLNSRELHSWKSERGETTLHARFSRDGKYIAYSLTSGGRIGIWVKQTVTGADPLLITRGKTDNLWPIWSPDDQQVAFVSREGDRTGIWAMPAFGGMPTLLKNLEETSPEPIRWSKDGRTIYYQWRSNLYALDLASKATTKMTNFDPLKVPFKRFSISPDENRIAYNDTNDGQIDIWVASMQGGDPVQVTDDADEDMHPVWHPDGKRIIYTSNRDGRYEICESFLDGRKPLQITSAGGIDRTVWDISSDGTRIVQISTRDDADIYGVEIDTGREFDVPHFEIGLKLWPEASPDGQTVAFHFASTLEKLMKSSIVSRPIAPGGRQTQLASGGYNLSWSPDGSKLAFMRLSDSFNIFTVNARGVDEKQLTDGGCYVSGYTYLPSNRFVRDYSWSPDSSKIAYSSGKSGAGNIRTINADGSGDGQITRNTDTNLNYYGPLWSPDGKRIAYVSGTRAPTADGKRIWSLRLAGPTESDIIFQAGSFVRLVGWSESGKDLIIAKDKDDNSANPIVVDVLGITTSGERRAIVSLNSAYPPTIQLSPDRRTIAFVSDRDGTDNIWVVPVTGREARRITLNTDPKLYIANPTFSPDSKAIYYSKQIRWNLISMIENFN